MEPDKIITINLENTKTQKEKKKKQPLKKMKTPEEEEEFIRKMLTNYIELPESKYDSVPNGVSLRYIDSKGEFKFGGYIIGRDLEKGVFHLKSHINNKIYNVSTKSGHYFYYLDRDLKAYKLHEQGRLFDFFAENTKGIDISKLIDGLIDGSLKMTIKRT